MSAVDDVDEVLEEDVTLANPYGPPVRGWEQERGSGAHSLASEGWRGGRHRDRGQVRDW